MNRELKLTRWDIELRDTEELAALTLLGLNHVPMMSRRGDSFQLRSLLTGAPRSLRSILLRLLFIGIEEIKKNISGGIEFNRAKLRREDHLPDLLPEELINPPSKLWQAELRRRIRMRTHRLRWL